MEGALPPHISGGTGVAEGEPPCALLAFAVQVPRCPEHGRRPEAGVQSVLCCAAETRLLPAAPSLSLANVVLGAGGLLVPETLAVFPTESKPSWLRMANLGPDLGLEGEILSGCCLHFTGMKKNQPRDWAGKQAGQRGARSREGNG